MSPRVPAWIETVCQIAAEEPADTMPGLRGHFRTVGDWLDVEPPAIQWLLRTRKDRSCWGDLGGVGVLPFGKVGLLASAGGVGKSRALVDLAVAVASGRDWLGAFEIATPGAVLLILAEDDVDDARRKLFHATRRAKDIAARAIGAAAAEAVHRAVATRVRVAALAGVRAALGALGEDGRTVIPGAWHRAIAAELADPPPGTERWALVILDPLSRFASGDTEKDNEAATRFVELAEQFAGSADPDRPGPAVILAHHSSKASRKEGDAGGNSIRGVSGLHDGVRWAATLEALPHIAGAPDLVRLAVVKSNLGPPIGAIDLCRGEHGILCMAQPEEREAYERARGRKTADPAAGSKAEPKRSLVDRYSDGA